MLSRARRASAGTVGRRSAARPRSSSSETSPRSWRTSGIEASSAASEDCTPGRRSAVNARSGGKDSLSAAERGLGGAQRARQLGDRRPQVALLAGERGGRRVEVGDQALELLGVAVQRRGRRARVLDVAREVVLGLAQRGLVDDRGVAVGALPVRDRAVEGLRAALVERVAVLVEQRLEVLARVGLQRGQQLVELDRHGGLVDRDRAVVGDLRRARRARLEVDEEVALEEDARADLGARVVVDRAAGLADGHRDHHGVAVLRRRARPS